MRVLIQLAFLVMLGTSISACAIVYKLPTRQGNVIDQKQLDKLKLGMTRQQVSYVMGTPIAQSPFDDNRWDYVGYYKPARGKSSSRNVTLYFEGDSLTRMVGVEEPANDKSASAPDAKTIYREQKKDENDATRGNDPIPSGVVITPPTTPTP
jgi:outer membrane protein assembly factor BamE